MKVILLKDVPGVGQKGSVQEVSDGFAMNNLLPKKFAEMATHAKLKAYAAEEKQKAQEVDKQETEWERQARLLKNAKVTIRVQANDKGHLYEQLHVEHIAERVAKELGVEVSPKSIAITKSIKALGRSEVKIKVGKKSVPLTVFVESEH